MKHIYKIFTFLLLSLNLYAFNINEIKTGDIILTKNNTLLSYGVSYFSNTKYSHSALIYQNPQDNKFYALEITVSYLGDKGKINIIPLEQYLSLFSDYEILINPKYKINLSKIEEFDGFNWTFKYDKDSKNSTCIEWILKIYNNQLKVNTNKHIFINNIDFSEFKRIK